MSRTKKLLFVFLALVLVMMMPLAASATALKFRAYLQANAQVDGIKVKAYGNADFTVRADGVYFKIDVHDLTDLKAKVVIDIEGVDLLVLCGDDGYDKDNNSYGAVAGKCRIEDGILKIEGLITAKVLAKIGLTIDDFVKLLASGKLYVSVYTNLNTSATLRGKIQVYVTL